MPLRPHDLFTLQFDTQIIGLDVFQIDWLDMPFMHRLTVRACPLSPSHHGPLIQPKGHYNRLQRAAIGQLGYDLFDHACFRA